MAYLNADNLPSTIGIYLFKKGDVILYIGKSVNIKARVKSHIEAAKLDSKESQIITAASAVDYLVTDSEFKAILLEARLIQKYHPKYNVIWKDNKSFLYIKITVGEDYPKVLLSRKEFDHQSLYFGPFSSVKTAADILREIRKIIPFCMQKNIKNKPCFYSKINLCNPCPSAIIRLKDKKEQLRLKKIYRQNIRRVIKLLQGEVVNILEKFYVRLHQLIRNQNFEEAILLRNKILRLEQLLNRKMFDLDLTNLNRSVESLKILKVLLQLYFPKLNNLNRIECYDISSLQSQNATASMVVLTNGLVDKTQYRKFKIKTAKIKSDFEMLQEVLRRRFKKRPSSWPMPNLIVVDGGAPQVRTLQAVLKKLKIKRPLIGIAKNPDRLILGLPQLPTIRPASNNLGFNLIRLLRDESHRFAHKYHLLLRKRQLLL